MFRIYKLEQNDTVDFAALELKKYLRMMMPECGDIPIRYDPDASEGFRLGYMQTLSLDVSDAENPELDDILYIDTDEHGGIIAGDNPRSVLIAVYEFFRQNGCRWLLPGVDGEYIPLKNIVPVKYRFAPSCRYRGWGTATAQFQPNMLASIDLAPKLGMNLFMIECMIPLYYYNDYYSHTYNKEARPPETVTAANVLQWKRQCEAEIALRGLQYHDVGHGFIADAFGEVSETADTDADCEIIRDKVIPESNYPFMAMIDGERKLSQNLSVYTQFCMSNPEGRRRFVKSIADYAEKHTNVDFLHVWLADGSFNHCECDECRKKTPADWYVMLMNEADEELTRRKLATRIVFIAYTDTMWAPTVERIKNPDRFTLCFAPIYRTYARTLRQDGTPVQTFPFVLNHGVYPKDLDESFAYLEEWKKVWKGSIIGFEYHSWSPHIFDLSGLVLARRINEDIRVYKQFDVDGLIEDGSQRHYFPHGLAVYSYARTMFDTSLTFEKIAEEYFAAAFGKDWKKFYDTLSRLSEAVPYEYFSRREAERRSNFLYDPSMESSIRSVRGITQELRILIRENYLSTVRLQTVSVRLLEMYADYCDMLSDAAAEKCLGHDDEAWQLYEKLRLDFGKRESGNEMYFDFFHFMSTLYYNFNSQTYHKQDSVDD